MHAPIDLAWLVARLRATVDVGGPWLSFVWAALACAALAACARRSARRADAQAALADERALALFFATALVVGVAGFALFLLAIGYPTQPWYYFSLLGLAAVSCEASLHLALRGAWLWRCARLALTVLALGLVAPALWRGNPERMTNLDRVAAELATRARPDDLIVVAPWYLGISFAHYYSGPTPWVTVPDLPDHSLTRYDLVKQHMIDPRGELESAERVRETLQRGARVFVVGELPFLEGNPPAIAPPVAPHSELGWREFHYQRLWSRMIAHALQTHATRVDAIPVELGVVSRFERPPLHAFGVGPL
jgi:hypothetical protein